MNRIVQGLIMLVIWSPTLLLFALTPKERIMVKAALEAVDNGFEEIRTAKEHGAIVQAATDSAHEETSMAKVEAYMAKRSAVSAGEKAAKAEKQAAELKAQNDLMLPVYNQVNAKCGFGAFAYGFGKLMHCFFWFIGGLAVAGIILLIFAPTVFPFIGRFFTTTLPGLFRRGLEAIRKLKPKPKPKP